MESTTVAVVGAGPAGLAMSRCLAGASIDHVLLERSRVAHSWWHQRWDSLRTLTPNWMNRLPGLPDTTGDPDGFMTATALAARLDRYAQQIAAPVRTGVDVAAVHRDGDGWRVETDGGPIRARAVVLATGAAGRPAVPALAAALPGSVQQLTPTGYRRPAQIEGERVLVVGAAATGVQVADELVRSGRSVVLSVGDHVRLPRTYRGRDIHWWMQATGISDERWHDVEAIDRARRVPSPQLIGSEERRSLDLGALRSSGVELVGRVVGLEGGRLQCSGSLANHVASADLKQARLLDRIDAFVAETGQPAEAPIRPAPTVVGAPVTELEVAGIDAVVWATGYRPVLPTLDAGLLDRNGRLRHDGGVAAAPGLYVLGLPFLRRRKSSFLDGIGADAVELATHLRAHLDRAAAA